MESETHYRRVGLFLIVSIIITAFCLIWFSHFFANDNRNKFSILFKQQSLDGLQKESIVTMRGIKVGVVDMRGRQIFNKSYSNTGLIDQNLQLDSVQAGVYLVTVQDGNRKEVKKIVVE